jgi:large subunit ribosomal protein L17
MRHAKRINHLGRTNSHRKAMLSNMASSLIMKKRLFTTLAKAKALRTVVEPLITKSKSDSTHSRRTVFSFLQDKKAVTELFREVSTKIGQRPGGYTRILKTGYRLGDNAEMCMIELVDYNENMLGIAKETKGKAKTTRRKTKTKVKTQKEEVKASEEVTIPDEKIVEKPVEKKETPKKPKITKEEVKAEKVKMPNEKIEETTAEKKETPKKPKTKKKETESTSEEKTE